MGTTCDAMLIYGVDLGSKSDPAEWLGDEWPPALAKLFDSDWGDDPEMVLADEFGLPSYRDNMTNDEAAEHFERLRVWGSNLPVEFFAYCGDEENSMWIVAVRGYSEQAAWGEAEPVAPEGLVVPPEPVAAFNDWLSTRAPGHPQPAWLLASYLCF